MRLRGKQEMSYNSIDAYVFIIIGAIGNFTNQKYFHQLIALWAN